jgi:hypothetical protein
VMPDVRRIDWLWESTATVAVIQGGGGTTAGVSGSMVWHFLFRFAPDTSGLECWREITDLATGVKHRKHFETSEWNSEFRNIVNTFWAEAFQDYERVAAKLSYDERQRLELFQEYRAKTAGRLNVTPVELQEILESTDR